MLDRRSSLALTASPRLPGGSEGLRQLGSSWWEGSVGVELLQHGHGVLQPVVVGLRHVVLQELVLEVIHTEPGADPVPVETAVTAATTVSIAETVVETEERREETQTLGPDYNKMTRTSVSPLLQQKIPGLL